MNDIRLLKNEIEYCSCGCIVAHRALLDKDGRLVFKLYFHKLYMEKHTI